MCVCVCVYVCVCVVVVEGEEMSLKPLSLPPLSALMSAFKYAEFMRRELVRIVVLGLHGNPKLGWLAPCRWR